MHEEKQIRQVKAQVCVLDDDPAIRDLLQAMLQKGNFGMVGFGSVAEFKNTLGGPAPDLMLLDLNLPDGNGLEVLPLVKRSWPDTEVIILTGFATYDAAVEATKKGAYHFQQKPFDLRSLLALMDRALEHKKLREEASTLRKAVSAMSGGGSPVVQSNLMRQVLRTVEKVAPSDAPVLITGESGTGKELVADLIHAMSTRAAGPLVKVNCAALPKDAIDAELFGPGATQTGAKRGLFRQADGGTILLDEICEMPLETQSRLLRWIEERTGAECRVLASTNHVLEQALKDGKLREDFYYRLGAVTVHIPPLRDRREDILPLTLSFLKRYSAQAGRIFTGLSPDAEAAVRAFDWPGNVRQLQNEMQRAVLMSDGPVIELQDLTIGPASAPAPDRTMSLLEGMEKNTIIHTLKETQGNKVEAARRLGIGRQTLYNKIKLYGIKV